MFCFRLAAIVRLQHIVILRGQPRLTFAYRVSLTSSVVRYYGFDTMDDIMHVKHNVPALYIGNVSQFSAKSRNFAHE